MAVVLLIAIALCLTNAIVLAGRHVWLMWSNAHDPVSGDSGPDPRPRGLRVAVPVGLAAAGLAGAGAGLVFAGALLATVEVATQRVERHVRAGEQVQPLRCGAVCLVVGWYAAAVCSPFVRLFPRLGRTDHVRAGTAPVLVAGISMVAASILLQLLR